MNDPQRPPGATTTVKAHLRIVDANNGKVKLDFEPVSATPYIIPGNSLIPIARGIDLSTLAMAPTVLKSRRRLRDKTLRGARRTLKSNRVRLLR